MRMPDSAAASPTANHGFWVVGHRGAPVEKPENTLPSFEAALANGANGLELDLCVTRDGQVVLWHDFNPHAYQSLARRFGLEPDVGFRPVVAEASRYRRSVDKLTLAEFREHHGYARQDAHGAKVPAHIPTLEEFLELAVEKRQLGLVFLDIKLPSRRAALLEPLLTRLDRVVAELRPQFEIVFESAKPAIIGELRKLAPRYAAALDIEPPPGVILRPQRYSAVGAALTHGLSWATAQKPRAMTFRPFETHCRIVTHDLALLQRRSVGSDAPRLCCFTINEEAHMRGLLALGVPAIQSDFPGRLRKVADDLGKRVDWPAAL